MKPEGAVRRYHSGMLPFAVDVYIDTYHGPSWVKQQLRGRSGWLQVSRARLGTPISDWTATLTTAVTDDGRQLGKVSSAAFLAMRSSSPQECFDDPPDELEAMSEMLFWDFLGGCDLRHLDMLAEGEAEIAARVAAEQLRGEKVLGEVEAWIANLRRQRRDPDCTPDRRLDLDAKVALLDEKHTAAAAWLVRRLAGIREEGMSLEADVLEALENHGEIEELYSARWTARSLHDRFVDRALMVDLTRTASLSGVPLTHRLDAVDRWEIAQAARKKLTPAIVIEPTKRKGKRVAQSTDRSQIGGAQGIADTQESEELTAWQKEERQLLASLAEWQQGKSGNAAVVAKEEVDQDSHREDASSSPLHDDVVPVPSPEMVLMQTTSATPSASPPDDSAGDIDALIERELHDLLKDLRLP